MKLNLGVLVQTPGVDEMIAIDEVMAALRRHETGDWGDMCDDDKQVNDEAVREGWRVLSSWKDSKGEQFWIVTEADRSVTTVLLPEEY